MKDSTKQQTAFEILAAKYILTFYEEAVVDAAVVDATVLETESYVKFIKKKANLYKLAQQKINDDKPLCMFITGPAGAGKCKSRNISYKFENKTKISLFPVKQKYLNRWLHMQNSLARILVTISRKEQSV